MLERAFIIEGACLYIPICAVFVIALWCPPNKRVWVASLIGTAWQVAILPWLNLLAQHYAWWSFQTTFPTLLGLPISLYLGWCICWGLLVIIWQESSLWSTRTRKWSVAIVCLSCVIADYVFMPFLQPVLVLGHNWLCGELLVIIVALIPSQLVARGLSCNSWLVFRTILVSLSFVLIVLTIIPLVSTAPDTFIMIWESKGQWERWFLIALISIAAVPGIAAVRQFAVRGLGTPIPQDPPLHLVTDGVYAYCSNPMQTSLVVVLIIWGVFWMNWQTIALALVSIIYSLGIATWSEKADLKDRFGKRWIVYRHSVPRWRFGLLPSQSPQEQSARLYIARDCNICAQLRAWFESKSLHGLDLCDAGDYPNESLTRVTYVYYGGQQREQGLGAVAAALQHLHLGYALQGWVIQLPLLSYIIQAALDVSGAGEVKRCKINEQQ